MNYAFTVTRHGTESNPITMITPIDYKKIWEKFQLLNLVMLYKFKHEFNDEGLRHVHYHGCVYSPKYLNYKEIVQEGFSIKFENPKKTDFERWHEYCMHEFKDKLKDVKQVKDELHGLKILSSVLDAGCTYSKPKQTKIKIKKKNNSVFKIVLDI